MNGVRVGLVSASQFFREGLKTLLSRNGYTVTGSVSDHREFDTTLFMADTPVLVLIDLAQDLDTAADQLRYLNDHMAGATIVAFSDEWNDDWLSICEDYDVSALLRKHVSFEELLHCLELVMIGKKVLPTNTDRCARDRANDAVRTGGSRTRSTRRAADETIPCMTCGQPFDTQDRRANRICSGCKTRISRIGTGIEHTLHH